MASPSEANPQLPVVMHHPLYYIPLSVFGPRPAQELDIYDDRYFYVHLLREVLASGGSAGTARDRPRFFLCYYDTTFLSRSKVQQTIILLHIYESSFFIVYLQ